MVLANEMKRIANDVVVVLRAAMADGAASLVPHSRKWGEAQRQPRTTHAKRIIHIFGVHEVGLVKQSDPLQHVDRDKHATRGDVIENWTSAVFRASIFHSLEW